MGMIEIKNISKSFDTLCILKDINLSIEKGSTLVILGKSGTGKSVLLKIIIGLLLPDKGEIFIDGKEVTSMNIKDLNKVRKKIGFLFQNAALYDSLSVRENLEFALRDNNKLTKKEKIEKVEKYLKSVDLFEAIEKMPSELSGGMRKRVGLARALVTEPKILLYDEPTTGLDPLTTRGISNLIVDIQKQFNLTSIVVTHDLECLRIVSNSIAMLNMGEIAFYGTYNDFEKTDNNIVREFCGINNRGNNYA
jgi:phospholipid/cholesterol/gamma-HCH transport system ATP-binding protein